MRVVTYATPSSGSQLGLWEGDLVYSLTAVDPQVMASFQSLVATAAAQGARPIELVWAAAPAARQSAPLRYADLDRPPAPGAAHLLKPLEPVEVWAAGVTYMRSRDAREAESGGATVYDRIYRAERPELFFKATAARVVGPNHPVGIRSDSRWQVPEPELGLVLGGDGALIGLTVGNDQSSRDIEAENPLYLPQAKVFRYSCAIGPAVLLVDAEPGPLTIRLTIRRGGAVAFEGETSTANLARSFSQLIAYLLKDNQFFAPTVLLTGTGIVPPDEFTLQAGDVVEIDIQGIGTLRNEVVALG